MVFPNFTSHFAILQIGTFNQKYKSIPIHIMICSAMICLSQCSKIVVRMNSLWGWLSSIKQANHMKESWLLQRNVGSWMKTRAVITGQASSMIISWQIRLMLGIFFSKEARSEVSSLEGHSSTKFTQQVKESSTENALTVLLVRIEISTTRDWHKSAPLMPIAICWILGRVAETLMARTSSFTLLLKMRKQIAILGPIATTMILELHFQEIAVLEELWRINGTA